MSNFNFIRIGFDAICMIALFVLVPTLITKDHKNKFIAIFLSFLLFLLTDNYSWLEVYSFSAVFMNYLIPVLQIVIILRLIYMEISNHKAYRRALIMLMIVLNCFYIEHVTVYMVCASFAFLIYSAKFNKKLRGLAVQTFASSIIGTILMFSYPLIYNADSNYRSSALSNGISFIFENILEHSDLLIFAHFCVTFVLSGFATVVAFFAIRRQEKKLHKLILFFCQIIFIGGFICSFMLRYGNWKDTPLVIFVSDAFVTALTLVYLLCLGVCIVMTFTGKERVNLLCLYLSIWLISAILSVVSPIGHRCFFITFTFIVMITIKFALYVMEQVPNLLKSLAVVGLGFVAGTYLFYIGKNYQIGHSVQMERQTILEQAIENGDKVAYVSDSVNFTDCGGLRFLEDYYYYVTPGDLEIIFE